MWIQTGVTVRKRLSWVVTSVTLTFDLDLLHGRYPGPWWYLLTISWWYDDRNIVKKVWRTDGQTDKQTENTIHRAAWSQLKIQVLWTSMNQLKAILPCKRDTCTYVICTLVEKKATLGSEWVYDYVLRPFSDSRQRGPYSPYKPCHHNLYIGITIFPHIDNTQSTGYNYLKKREIERNTKKWGQWSWYIFGDFFFAFFNSAHWKSPLALSCS